MNFDIDSVAVLFSPVIESISHKEQNLILVREKKKGNKLSVYFVDIRI